jgi:hypothetical protein
MRDVEALGPGLCTRQPALTARRNVKFHSSQLKADQSIVENASRSIDVSDKDKLLNIL